MPGENEPSILAFSLVTVLPKSDNWVIVLDWNKVERLTIVLCHGPSAGNRFLFSPVLSQLIVNVETKVSGVGIHNMAFLFSH